LGTESDAELDKRAERAKSWNWINWPPHHKVIAIFRGK
jgi:hypothetical protein